MGGMSRGVVLPGLDSDVFANASTITAWLHEQPEDVKLRLTSEIFSELLRNSGQPRQTPGQVCMKLCGLVTLCAKSADEDLRQWAFAHDTSMALFNFYVEWNEGYQQRSMKLVLDVLVTTSTQNPDPEVGAITKAAVLDSLVTIVSRQSLRSFVKSSMHSLVYFFIKHVISVEDVGTTYRKVKPSVSELPDLQLWTSFVADVFSWMHLCEVSPIAGKLLVQIFHGLQEQASDSSQPAMRDFGVGTWLEWIQDGVVANPGILESIKNNVFAPLFKADRSSSLQLLEHFNRQKQGNGTGGKLDSLALLQLGGLELGRKSGLLDEPGTDTSTQPRPGAIVIRQQVLGGFLDHPSSNVRSSALALLVSSPFTTRPIPQETFNLLRRHLATYHSDDDKKTRQEMLGYLKGFINRVKNVISSTQRSLSRREARGPNSANTHSATVPQETKSNPEDLPSNEMEALERHESFFRWYMTFLRDELISTASYQRHITAIKALHTTLKIVKLTSGTDDCLDVKTITTVFTDPTWVRLIMDLIMDPFDDVRETATMILQMLPQDVILTHVELGANSSILLSTLREFCTRATNLAGKTSRADHGNGAARAQGLLCSWLSSQDARVALILATLDRLEAKLSRADQSLGQAVVEDSVHVDFAALGYIWQVLLAGDKYSDSDRESLQQVQRRMLKSCDHVWNIVQHVLCDDSPEGHLPEELEEVKGLDTRDLLSYSFRAIHESSNLMRIITSGLRDCDTTTSLYPPLDVFSGIGSLTFVQLSTLRHRGAFATVSSTFAVCCQLTPGLADVFPDMPTSENYLQRWYEGAIECILNQASTTRRSAGIPALVMGVLAANAESPSFKEVLPTLVRIAEKTARISETDGSKLPQVHALNCLKDIFKAAGLSRKAEAYLPTVLQLATNSLRSEVWAIRNCGLLLLRSLIDCLFGTGESKSSIESGWDGYSIRIAYGKYPSLPGVLLSLLKPESESLELSTQSGGAEAVFPALDIIRRAGPPHEHRDELYEYIEEYLGSRLWHVREMAARTLCSFLLRDGWIEALRGLLCRSRGAANRLHGTLLTIKFVVERKMDTFADETKGNLPQLVSALDELLHGCQILHECPDVWAALLEISNLISKSGLSKALEKSAVLTILGETPESNRFSNTTTPSALLQMQLGMKALYECARNTDVGKLQLLLNRTLEIDADTACIMLKAIPETWQGRETLEIHSQLCELYVDLHQHTDHPEPREIALLNLKCLMDSLLRDGKPERLPSEQRLQQLWAQTQLGEMNPSLSQATLEISGTLMATAVIRDSANPHTLQCQIQRWGDMLANALDIDNTFETRFAAAEAIRSFSSTVGPRTGPHYLPYLLALYDALNDDDDEIRHAAAAATTSIVGKGVASLEAANLLVDWISRSFNHVEAFRSAVICRMAGQQISPDSTDQTWTSAEKLLGEAMRFDDTLFAVEEQNLFIDEIRESKRWRRIFKGLSYAPEEEAHKRLQDWTTAGMRALNKLAQRGDGPLGWTFPAPVFAICARVLLCAGALHDISGNTLLRDLLHEFTVAGRKSGFHGSLLHFAELEGSQT